MFSIGSGIRIKTWELIRHNRFMRIGKSEVSAMRLVKIGSRVTDSVRAQ
jgi:hypothetical protein